MWLPDACCYTLCQGLRGMLCARRTLLGARLSQLSVMRGESTRHKLLLVKDISPAAVFDKLQSQLQKQKK